MILWKKFNDLSKNDFKKMVAVTKIFFFHRSFENWPNKTQDEVDLGGYITNQT
jgi:hypothetical protein